MTREKRGFQLNSSDMSDTVKKAISWRRYFHRHAELGFKEFDTSKKIQSLLKEFGIPFEVKAKTGVVGTLKGSGKGKTIGIRSDMDALPILEETGLSFSSKNTGVMHACGHDAHMATVLGTAMLLSKYRKRLKGTVKFIFQPCEEQPPGGALQMIKEGVIDDVDFLIGFHNFSVIPLGKIWIGSGPVMANTDIFHLLIKGKGGHGSTPHLTNDTIVCAAYLICQLQTIISRRLNPFKSGVVSLGQINGGNAFNVIPGQVEIKGTVRSLEDEVRETIKKEIRGMTGKVSESFHCKGVCKYHNYSPSCINDPELSAEVLKLSRNILSGSDLFEFHPVMGGEDFAFFSRKIPSCYIFIGIGKESGVHHNNKFSVNEKIFSFSIPYFTELLLKLARA